MFCTISISHDKLDEEHEDDFVGDWHCVRVIIAWELEAVLLDAQ